MAKARKDRAKPPEHEPSERHETRGDLGLNLGGFLGRLGGPIEKLGELAEAGEEFSRSGEIKGLDPSGKLRGVYGFSIKTGLGEQGQRELKVEPFGNVHRRSAAGGPVVEDVREPLVDVYEEEDHVLVLAEIPGVSKKDVQVDLCKDQLTLSAQRGEKSYRKEVTLPEEFSPDKMRWDCANGILRIRIER